LLDDDDVVMNDENDEVIERGQFPPNIPSKDFFHTLSQPIYQPLSDKIKQEKLKLAFDLLKIKQYVKCVKIHSASTTLKVVLTVCSVLKYVIILRVNLNILELIAVKVNVME
jgi:hypothetical protein